MASNVVDVTLEVNVPVARAWRAFAETSERSQWEARPFEIDPVPGGRVHWELPGLVCDGRVEEVVPEQLLRHTEGTGPHHESEVTVTFEPVPEGTRIHVLHTGHGEGEDGECMAEAVTLGWTQALADLVVWLEHGVPAERFVRRNNMPGMALRETPGGLVVHAVDTEGLGESAGLAPGDLLLSVCGAAVFTHSDLWVITREHAPGTRLPIEYVRDGKRCEATGTL